ncbi:MAG: lasso peptide biosynthesis B2 protein [Pseudomonadota bacterium]
MQKFTIWTAARYLPIWVIGRDFERVLSFFAVPPNNVFKGSDPKILCDYVVSSTKKPWFMRDRRCLRQGLLAMRFLRKAGCSPVLRFGIDTGSLSAERLSAHCWVEMDGDPIMNTQMDDMIVIYEAQ